MISSVLWHLQNTGVIDVVLVFLLLTSKIYFTPFYIVSIVDFEQVNVSWVTCVINQIVSAKPSRHLLVQYQQCKHQNNV